MRSRFLRRHLRPNVPLTAEARLSSLFPQGAAESRALQGGSPGYVEMSVEICHCLPNFQGFRKTCGCMMIFQQAN